MFRQSQVSATEYGSGDKIVRLPSGSGVGQGSDIGWGSDGKYGPGFDVA